VENHGQMEKNMENIINDITVLVKNACKSDKNTFGYGIWSNHIKPMLKLGQKLAEEFGADKEIVTISILLHDLAGIENNEHAEEHHIIGAEKAEKILKDFNYPDEKIEKIKLCILNHRSSINNDKNSIEEICVADSDAIAHIFEISSLFYFAYNRMEMSIDEGQEWVKNKLKKDYQKLSERSKMKYKNEFEIITKILDKSKTST
jgi:uncharacterized protein